MSSFRDFVKKVNDEKNTASTKKQYSHEQYEKESGSSFRDLVRKVNDGTVKVPAAFNSSQVDDWYKGLKSVYRKGYSYLSADGYKAPDQDILGKIDQYLEQANAVGQYLRTNRDVFTDYDSAYKSYVDGVSSLRSLRNNLQDSNRHFSKFKSEDDYNAAVASGQEYYKLWGEFMDAEDFDTVSRKRNYQNPSEYDLKYYDAMLDNKRWYWDANNVYRDAFGNEIPLPKENGATIVHPMKDDERFAVADPVGLFLSTDKEKRENAPYEDWARDSYRYGQILIKGANEHWELLTQNDLNMYYYLLGTYGTDKAMEYIDYYAENRNAQYGAAEAQRIMAIEDDFMRVGYMGMMAIAAGSDNWASGVTQALGADARPTSDLQYTSETISNSLDGFGKYVYGAGVTVGNMLPSIIISKGLGATAGAVAVGTSAGGNAYGQALKEGYSEGQARNYGFLVGASEATLQRLIGGIGELGGITDDILLSKVSMIDSSLLRISAKLGISIGSEIFEEELQLFLEPAFKSIIMGEDYDAPTIDEMLETAVVTAISTGALESGGTIAKDAHENKQLIDSGRTIMGVGGGATALVNLASEVSGASPADIQKSLTKQSQTVSKKVESGSKSKTTARRVGRLYDTVQTATTSLNQADIVKSLTRGENGLSKKTATAIAEAMVAQFNGKDLSPKQTRLLNTYKDNERVKNATKSIVENAMSTIGQRSQSLDNFTKTIEIAKMIDELKAKATKSGDVTTEAKTLPESHYDVSAEGKTFQKSTGNELHVKMFASVGGKDATVTSESGENVSLSDVSWGNESEALVMQSIPSIDHIDTHGANTILHAYRSGDNNVSAASFISGAAHVFKSGFFNGKPLDEYTAKLTPNQVDLIYNAGREAAAEYYRAEQEKADKKNKAAAEKDSTAAKKGGVFYGYDGKTIDQRNDGKHKPPTQDQRVAIDFTKRMAKRFGSTVYFYESYVDENGNRVYKAQDGTIKKARGGFYDPKDGSIHIDLNGDHVLFTVSHELVHFIKDWSPKQFKKMADLVMEGFNRQGLSVEELIANKQKEYAEDGIKLTEDQAFEEVVADSLEGIMADGRVMELMQKLEAEDKSLGAKVKKFFQDIGKMIRKAIDTYKGSLPDSAEGRLIRQMEDIHSQLQEAFAEGVYDAGESFRNAENTTNEGGVRYKNGEYWHPDMTKTEIAEVRSLAKHEAYKTDNYLGIDSKWLYNSEKGHRYFALYSSIDSGSPTVLYACKGEGAKTHHNYLMAALQWEEDIRGSINGGSKPIIGLLNSIESIISRETQHPGSVVETGSDNGNASVHSRNKRIRLDKAFINCLRNIEEVQQRYGIDDHYQFAVDRGDYATAQQMVAEAAKSAGYSIKAFHGTPVKGIKVFDKAKIGSTTDDGIFGSGFYFTTDRLTADGYATDAGTNMPVFLNVGKSWWGLGHSIKEVAELLDVEESILTVRKTAMGSVVAPLPKYAKTFSEHLIQKGYNSVIVQHNANNYEIVMFDNKKIKSAETVTYDDNGDMVPLSERFNMEKNDIRYSVGRKTDRAAQGMVEKENDALREDVAQLKDLLKLQGKETHGTKFTPSSVESAARYLKKNAGAKGDTNALAKLLNSFYEYIATEKELTWDGVREQAKPIAQWLMDHREHTRSDYAQEVLDQIHGSRVHLDETQLAEAVYRFESYDAFRRSMAGAITISRNAEMSLDSWWHEMAGMYPDVFNADTTASDMPGELFDIVNRLRNENSSALEYEHNRRWIEQDLIRDVYDSYWRVSNLRTVADRYAAQMNRLKSQHAQRISNMKAETQKKIEQLKEQHKAEVQVYRNAFRQSLQEQMKELSTKYQESRKKDVDSRHRTVMRQKIRKVIRDLDKILNRGDKKRNVKEDMKDFVAEALSAAEVLFTDNYTNEDIIRNGFGVELTKEESKYLEEAREIIEELSNLPVGGFDAWQARQEAEEKLKSKLAYRMSKLKDAFFRERQRLNKAEVAEVLGNLADAYAKLETSEYAYVNGAYHEAVYQYLKMLQEDVGGAKIKDMTLGQLEELHKAYTMVLTTVQNANKMFAEDLKQSKEELAKHVMMEVHKAGGEHGLWTKGQLARNQASWNNTKPIYAAERTGSSTFVQLVKGLFKGQYNWATDMEEAKAFRQMVAKKYGFKNWDMEKTYKFTSSSGVEFELNLNQIMSLYAYAKREQAHDHLLKGGFVFGKNTEVVVTKNGIKRTYLNKTAKAHNISDELMGEIVSKLSAEQKGFVDEMQDYLSTTMGEKGNEVSMRLYGVKLFMEKFYFPLRSAGQFKEKAKEAELKQQQGQISIVNSGFTKAVTPKASNPVVLDGFTDVWAGHVNEMSLYHSMVLPMEDFRRVYNYASPNMEGQESASVNSAIENAYGDAATGYFDQLYNELNGGAIVDPRENLSKQMIGKFKKAAVMLSNSVVVQQFSAIGRAYALINPKYFIGAKVDKKKHTALWNEMKKYAPVAIIKEMGGFDTHTGLSAKDYLMAEEYSKGEKVKGFIKDKQYRGDVMGYLPAKADELTWCAIWEAVKRETKAKNPKMDVKSEEFLKKAGERFSEVIEKTQVYDSVLARSANMRSKNGLMQMLTAFMAEPTTTVNMVEDALRKGNKKVIAGTFGAVAASVILNNALAAIVYAMRDDDEDETFLEKYSQAFVSGTLDDINPMTYYPVLKDIWSLFQGYDIERSDMAIYSDIADSVKKVVTLISKYDSNMDDDEATKYYKDVTGAVMSLLDAGASAFGIPWKNVRRDLVSYYNTYKTFASGDSTTWNSFVDAIAGSALDSIPVVGLVAGKSDTDKLYNAIISGDTVYANRLKDIYKDQNAINNAIRKGLRENDPRIHEAAIAWNANDLDEYMRIAREIIAEEHFVQDDVVMAIRAEASALEPDEGTSSSSKTKGLFTEEKFAEAISQGDAAMANAIKTDIIQTAMKNGKTAEEAEKSFNSSAKSKLKEQFLAGNIAEKDVINALTIYCGIEKDEAIADVQYWAFKQDYPDVHVDDKWFDTYYDKIVDSGLDIDVYMDYRNKVSTITGEGKKEKRMAVIDALPITRAQKDALYLAEGWAESKIYEAPWH